MKRWTIYCHIHINTGRRYIGLTSKTMLARWNGHVNLAKRSNGRRSHFTAAIRKYGKDAFFHEILEICHNLEVANLAEECWVELYETRNPEKGFNLMRGGEHIPHPIRSNPWNDPGYRAKCTDLARERAKDPAWRAHNSAALTGRKLSDDHRRSISISRIRQTASPERRTQMSLITSKLWQDPSYGRNLQRKVPSEKICPKHGSISLDSCYRRMHKNGLVWYMCKQCASDHNKRRMRIGNGLRIMRSKA